MRVTRLGPDCLRVRPVREVMLLFVPGLVFAIGSFILSWFVGQSATLSCERVGAERPRCELRRTLLGWPVKTVVIKGLKSARVERRWNTDGETHEMRFVTTGDADSSHRPAHHIGGRPPPDLTVLLLARAPGRDGERHPEVSGGLSPNTSPQSPRSTQRNL